MGKAGRWLRNLFLPGRKAKDKADTDSQSVLSAPAVATPSVREKRRWSFRRPAAAAKADAAASGGPLASSSSLCFSEAEVRVVVAQDDQHAAAAAAAANTPRRATPSRQRRSPKHHPRPRKPTTARNAGASES
ncbi:unnamed protein product [Urochloa humidicola]